MDDLHKKIEVLQEEIATWRNLRGSEVEMNKELKEYNKKLELSLEYLIKVNENLLSRVVKLRELLLK
tara:strand:- start:303 stop:503 length:201 start_codon:yes stop_codon:yes gene_type:complete